MIAEDLCNPAFADAIQKQQRFAVQALHQYPARFGHRLDLAEPAPPLGIFGAVSRQARGHRVTIADIGEPRPEPPFQHFSGRRRRHHLAQGRLVKRPERREFGPHRQQQRPAFVHEVDDIAQVRRRQHVADHIAVENDEVEFPKFGLEQLLDGKSDQRKLAKRREVVLFRRPQDGEMNQVNGRVGFEQITPCSFAGVGLSRNQQHPKPVSDPVNADQRPVVEGRKFPRGGIDLKLDHRRPGMIEGKSELVAFADRGLGDFFLVIVVAHPHPCQVCPEPLRFFGPTVLDPVKNGDFLADDSVTGRLFDDQPAIRFPGLAGQQHMNRARYRGRRRHVVDLSVGDQNGTGKTPAGDFTRRRPQARPPSARHDRG